MLPSKWTANGLAQPRPHLRLQEQDGPFCDAAGVLAVSQIPCGMEGLAVSQIPLELMAAGLSIRAAALLLQLLLVNHRTRPQRSRAGWWVVLTFPLELRGGKWR